MDNNPVSWGCRMHGPHLCGGVKTPNNECLGYNSKLSDSEASALELLEM